MNFVDFAERRRGGRINLHNEILEETPATQQASYRQIARESRHGLEGIAEYHDCDFVKIHRGAWAANHSAKVVSNAILQAAYSQRVTQVCMKNANISP